jgi:hypothetical protein
MDLFPSAEGGNDNDGTASTTTAGGQMVDLRDKIDNAGCYARNEAAAFPMSNLFIGDSRLGCKSDADEQLILHIAFQEFVKVCANLHHACTGKPFNRVNCNNILQF